MKRLLFYYWMAACLAAAFGGVPAAAQQQPRQPGQQKTEQPQKPAAQPQPPPPAASPQKPEAKSEEEEYEIVERPSAFGTMRFRVPKQKGAPASASGGVASGAGSPAEQKPATPQQLAPTATAPGAGPAAAAPQSQPPAPAQPVQPAPAQEPASGGGARVSLHLENANLLQVIGIIAAELKMNYIVDPGVKGVVNINTLGELRQEDLLPLLQTILRTNGATAVQSGSFWRIVQSKEALRIPIPIDQDASGASLPPDDRVMMNIVSLRFDRCRHVQDPVQLPV